jgi:hypothetical protein
LSDDRENKGDTPALEIIDGPPASKIQLRQGRASDRQNAGAVDFHFTAGQIINRQR